jgi:hypothetical protein
MKRKKHQGSGLIHLRWYFYKYNVIFLPKAQINSMKFLLLVTFQKSTLQQRKQITFESFIQGGQEPE